MLPTTQDPFVGEVYLLVLNEKKSVVSLYLSSSSILPRENPNILHVYF